MTHALNPHTTEFMVELLTEEIPARFQPRAWDEFKQCFLKSAETQGMRVHTAEVYITPRRMTLVATLDAVIPAQSEERRGPRIGASAQALLGFCKGAGIAEDALIQRDGYYYAHIATPEKPVSGMLGEVYQNACKAMTWPKVMRWPQSPTPWVRPVRHVCALLGGAFYPMALSLFNLSSSPHTFGHRFLSPKEITPTSFQDYCEKLESAYVIVDQKKRAHIITQQLQKHATTHNIVLHVDDGLLQENVGLVEYPGVFLGRIDPKLMTAPDVAIITSMRYHQKCFAFYASADQSATLAPYFGVVVNTVPGDNGHALAKGYEQGMLKARLEDARYFYTHDLNVPLANYIPKYATVTFHDKLGTLADKVGRMTALAHHAMDALRQASPSLDANMLMEAISLCKADLFTQMVGEFDELQGIMGEIYARAQGQPEAVAIALREYYQPLGPDASVPQSELGCILALLDKLDTIFGFIGVGMAPSGSKDPFALRRAALGVIRILREHAIDLDILPFFKALKAAYAAHGVHVSKTAVDDTIEFFTTRLAHTLKHEGLRHDIIACALSSAKTAVNIARLARDAQMLAQWCATQKGAATITSIKRVSAILSTLLDSGEAIISPDHFHDASESALYNVLIQVEHQMKDSTSSDHKLTSLEPLASPIHAFFEAVMIQHDDPTIRTNRIGILRRIHTCAQDVCDFEKLDGM